MSVIFSFKKVFDIFPSSCQIKLFFPSSYASDETLRNARYTEGVLMKRILNVNQE